MNLLKIVNRIKNYTKQKLLSKNNLVANNLFDKTCQNLLLQKWINEVSILGVKQEITLFDGEFPNFGIINVITTTPNNFTLLC
ncbi:hypothetical protein EGP91_04315 [bacterium]|nr:hypothetical protein [bacterium]